MSKLYDMVEPSVISEEMLLAAIKEQGPKDENGEMANHDALGFNEVKSLRLDYKSEFYLTKKNKYGTNCSSFYL